MKHLLASAASLALITGAFLVTPPATEAARPGCNDGGSTSLCAEVCGPPGNTFCLRMLCSDANGAENCYKKNGDETGMG
ncbi:MAG: hypothetical protein ACK41D_12395 [Rubricoccaceae bacterium]